MPKHPSKLVSLIVLTVVLISIAFLALYFSGYLSKFFSLTTLRSTEQNPQESTEVAEAPYTPNSETQFTGTLRKEPIPAELNLPGEWFNLYFDQPYYLELNSTGEPLYVFDLQVQESEGYSGNIDDFDGKHVTINGILSWGYAESRVILPEMIKEVPLPTYDLLFEGMEFPESTPPVQEELEPETEEVTE